LGRPHSATNKMKTYITTLVLFAGSALFGQTPGIVSKTQAEIRIDQAQTGIRQNPKKADGYASLAAALLRRELETSDPNYRREAETAIEKALAIEPDHFEALKARTMILLRDREYSKAQDLARKLNKRTPDDVPTYGLVAEASVALGDYKEAEEAVQWMLDMRPGNVPAYLEGATLRELFGEIDGARDFLTQAYQRIRPEEAEERASILLRLSHLALLNNNPVSADRLAEQARKLFPAYPAATLQLARVRLAQKNYSGAADLFRQVNNTTPRTEYLFDLADALDKAGNGQEAAGTFAEFEKEALAKSEQADNANRQLIRYYLDRSKNVPAALRIAKREASLRHDSYTLDLYAWGLYASGRKAEAKTESDRAMAVGLRDPDLLAHAKMIASN
jgi:tetratricopeptide (TPR) repeat protein